MVEKIKTENAYNTYKILSRVSRHKNNCILRVIIINLRWYPKITDTTCVRMLPGTQHQQGRKENGSFPLKDYS